MIKTVLALLVTVGDSYRVVIHQADGQYVICTQARVTINLMPSLNASTVDIEALSCAGDEIFKSGFE